MPKKMRPPRWVGRFVIVQPAAEGSRPWLGQVVDPRHSELGAAWRPEDAGLYAVVRCLDSGQARGIAEGDDYLVRAIFLRCAADAFLPAHSETRDDATGEDAAS